MKSTVSLFVLSLLVAFLWNAPHSGPSAAPVSPSAAPAGTWTTGAVGTLGDVVYGSGTHYIDLATEGLYDPVLWVVILDYNTLTVQANATVRFLNHPSRAPVVIRAVGDIVIDGHVNLDGASGHTTSEGPTHAEPGPGGFRGGTGTVVDVSSHSDGLGVGGGYNPNPQVVSWAGGSHASQGQAWTGALAGPTYGSGFAAPLIGGSGGTGASTGAGGGAGGGAVLIGSDTSISLTGTIHARGGQSGWNGHPYYVCSGAGGMIRLASPVISSSGGGTKLNAQGGYSLGSGWVRVETIGAPIGGNILSSPGAFHAQTLGEFLPAALPTVTVSSWWDDAVQQWIPLTQDPHAVIDNGMKADVRLPASGLRTLRLEGRGVPLGSPLHVRTSHTQGRATIDSTRTMGEVAGSTEMLSWTEVQVDFSLGISTIQVRAELP